MHEEISKQLVRLGFTEYEAKAYLALLQQAPMTGYAIALASGVPRSKIYEVLGNLVERGDVLISRGEPVQYAPKRPDELIASRRQLIEKQLSEAENGLAAFQNRQVPNDLIWDIRGRAEIFFRLGEVIERAKEQILLQIWEDDAPEIQTKLEAAAQRGVKIWVVAYGDPQFPLCPGLRSRTGGGGNYAGIRRALAYPQHRRQRNCRRHRIDGAGKQSRLVGAPGDRDADHRTDQT